MKADVAEPGRSLHARPFNTPAAAAFAIALVAAATILGAFYFQYVRDMPPCPLCLDERIPYYVAIPLGLVVALAARSGAPRALVVAGLALLALTMLVGAGLGVYHAGIEWKFWAGPQDCTGPLNELGGPGGLLQRLNKISVVRCDQVSWRLFGLSLAGWNAVVALGLALVALVGLAGFNPRRR